MDADFDRRALWSISYGVYIVTSRLNEKLNGQIANTVVQVTSEPPRVAVTVNKSNLTHEYIRESGVFGVSVLAESTPMDMIGLFGFRSGREVDKFAAVAHRTGASGAPLVTDHALSIFDAKMVETTDVGTHTIFAGEVVGGETLVSGAPLTYAAYRAKKGATPKAAPTYRAATQEPPASAPAGAPKMRRYKCDVCDYIYDPNKGDPDLKIAAGVPFEDLPDDWLCPVCGAPKEMFSPMD